MTGAEADDSEALRGLLEAKLQRAAHLRDRLRTRTATEAPVSPAHALRVAGHTDAQIEDFYARLRVADEATARQMIDNPTGWDT